MKKILKQLKLKMTWLQLKIKICAKQQLNLNKKIVYLNLLKLILTQGQINIFL